MVGACVIITCLRVRNEQEIPCITLYKEYRKNEPDGFYSIPGGHLKKNEDPILGALRETEEESFLKFNKEELKGPIFVNNCYFYLVRFDKISRKEFLRKRFDDPKSLKWEQKETWDLRLVPIIELQNLKSRFIKDIYGNEIKLRDILYDELKKEPKLLLMISEMFQKNINYQLPTS